MQRFLLPLLLIAVLLGWFAPARAQTRLRNICRVKGQEENQLVGLGLVVGLRGTGDTSDYLPTIRSLARAGANQPSKTAINSNGNRKRFMAFYLRSWRSRRRNKATGENTGRGVQNAFRRPQSRCSQPRR